MKALREAGSLMKKPPYISVIKRPQKYLWIMAKNLRQAMSGRSPVQMRFLLTTFTTWSIQLTTIPQPIYERFLPDSLTGSGSPDQTFSPPIKFRNLGSYFRGTQPTCEKHEILHHAKISRYTAFATTHWDINKNTARCQHRSSRIAKSSCAPYSVWGVWCWYPNHAPRVGRVSCTGMTTDNGRRLNGTDICVTDGGDVATVGDHTGVICGSNWRDAWPPGPLYERRRYRLCFKRFYYLHI